MHISSHTRTTHTVWVPISEFKEKLGIPEGLDPFTVYVGLGGKVEIKCSGKLPTFRDDEVDPFLKKRWWRR